MSRRKRILVLGSTGSIGRQTLEVAEALPDRLQVVGLAAGRNARALAEQARRWGVTAVALADPAGAPILEAAGLRPYLGEDGLVRLVEEVDADLVVVATTGRAGFRPTLRALELGREVALANKEVLVMAGALVTEAARRAGVPLRPIDSEHSALWQCLQGEPAEGIRRVILTASGGPFRTWSRKRLSRVRPEDALNHPTWRMGAKITVDSATLLNKGLEVIETHWLFGLPYERIQVVIHPQSIVHSLVEFRDGSQKAQLGHPDMRLPIQYALSWPERWPAPYARPFWPPEVGSLTFEEVDRERFPCLDLAYRAGAAGRTYPTVLSAADEVAVAAFLAGELPFLGIPALLADLLDRHVPEDELSLEAIEAADLWARREAKAWIRRQVEQLQG